MAYQVKPDINPEEFLKAALKTGKEMPFTKGEKKYVGRMIDPVGLMKSFGAKF